MIPREDQRQNLGRLKKLPGDSVAGSGKDHRVEFPIEAGESATMAGEFEPSSQIRVAGDLVDLVTDLGKPAPLGVCRQAGCLLGSMGFEGFSDFVEFPKIPRGHLAKVHTRLRTVLNQPLGLKPKQRFADRAPAEVEFFGQQSVRQPLARPHVTVKQKAPYLRIGGAA